MWKPGRRGSKTMYEFLQSYSKFALLIIDFIQEFRLYLALIEGNSQNGVVSIFQDKDIRYAARRSKEEPMKIKITSPAKILGLENELEI